MQARGVWLKSRRCRCCRPASGHSCWDGDGAPHDLVEHGPAAPAIGHRLPDFSGKGRAATRACRGSQTWTGFPGAALQVQSLSPTWLEAHLPPPPAHQGGSEVASKSQSRHHANASASHPSWAIASRRRNGQKTFKGSLEALHPPQAAPPGSAGWSRPSGSWRPAREGTKER